MAWVEKMLEPIDVRRTPGAHFAVASIDSALAVVGRAGSCQSRILMTCNVPRASLSRRR